MPIGKEGIKLKSSEPLKDEPIVENPEEDKKWIDIQNQAYNLVGEKALFLEKELAFLQKAGKIRLETWGKHPSSANVGSWWAAIFDQTRFALASVKNARSWEIPTAFGDRSTVSGIGAVVHPGDDWLSEGQSKKYWERKAGLFDGKEKLNATETVKRGLHKILPDLLNLTEEQIKASYPDLTAGVAGYLKTGTEVEKEKKLNYFHQVCSYLNQKIIADQKQIPQTVTQAWGIPWIDNQTDKKYGKYHPRFLNAGWLVEELDTEADISYRQELQQEISQYYPANNPADWYVLSAGDGDGMSDWLKGDKLGKYQDYIAPSLSEKMKNNAVSQEYNEFIQLQKRMGPSTHSALSRALLDFSNQLVPYLTEERYAGRLIYGGGDDVLAYSNLWEWDRWLWDLRQCFKGKVDPHHQFDNRGDYWQWENSETIPKSVSPRPLFTMGKNATISFGIIIAHHSVPMAISLENMWEAEEEAKENYYKSNGKKVAKDAVQVRVIYGNGNILKATAKFAVFEKWQQLLNSSLEPSIFELSASLWKSHPAPTKQSIKDWVINFTTSRNINSDHQKILENCLNNFLTEIWAMTPPNLVNEEIINWFKLASFMIRKREIKIN